MNKSQSEYITNHLGLTLKQLVLDTGLTLKEVRDFIATIKDKKPSVKNGVTVLTKTMAMQADAKEEARREARKALMKKKYGF